MDKSVILVGVTTAFASRASIEEVMHISCWCTPHVRLLYKCCILFITHSLSKSQWQQKFPHLRPSFQSGEAFGLRWFHFCSFYQVRHHTSCTFLYLILYIFRLGGWLVNPEGKTRQPEGYGGAHFGLIESSPRVPFHAGKGTLRPGAGRVGTTVGRGAGEGFPYRALMENDNKRWNSLSCHKHHMVELCTMNNIQCTLYNGEGTMNNKQWSMNNEQRFLSLRILVLVKQAYTSYW
jgi:hypothetical protein